MRSLTLAALVAVSSASLVQLHSPAYIPQGWTQTSEKVNPNTVFRALIGLTRPNIAELYKFVDTVSDPEAYDYLNYLNHEEMADRVRPPAANTAVVKAWLARHKVTDIKEHLHGDYIAIKATASQLEGLAGGQFVQYEHTTGMKVHRITGGVNVPSEVAAVIDTFSGFAGFPLKRVVETEQQPQVGLGCKGCVVTPPLLRRTYNVSSVQKSGKTNIIATVQFQGQNSDNKDLKSFCHDYDNGGECNITKWIGKNNPMRAETEPRLDTEYAFSLAKTTSWVYSFPDMDFCGDLLSFSQEVISESEYAQTISLSYGTQYINGCHHTQVQRFSDDVMKLSGMGITLVISSGDSGSGHTTLHGVNEGRVNPSYPASVPYALAVGSTFFISGTSGPEEASTAFGSGGGFSFDFPAPAFQQDAIKTYLHNVPRKPHYRYASEGRGSPDVSCLGQNYTVRVGGEDFSVKGTSASAPVIAGIIGLLNEECLRIAGKTLGFINPLFYQHPGAFRDVTQGTNGIGMNAGEGWEAIRGWDAATGLGTPNFPALLQVVRSKCQALANRNNVQ